MAYTGGELNWLNGRYGISAPANSVPVMKLIRTHCPKTRSELCELIGWHYRTVCPCGIRSRGTVADFGKNLYDAQMRAWGRYRYSLRDCIQWEYDLFVSQSLKGRALENSAMTQLRAALPHLIFTEARGYLDEELRIDILIQQENRILGGVQVKPRSFNHMRQGVIHRNHAANRKLGRPVIYLFYDNAERFVNLPEALAAIRRAGK
ncbi:hypothetical protein DENIS_4846 [Desulfonema ishimotonii]|uniref:Restriction endonuclease n=1 Tax=Desulfonema ishimotonii TaxID=45657 RepID=A0A401G3M8_9BACT|nr:hypothetical protein [Desulfonema ishimotonii]GBC63847.1 hypothetical protein DENIS_4846 [Desulfonema ishimotonii]